MPNTRYFELNDDVGRDPEGNPEPLKEIGVAIAVPTVKDGEIVDVPQRIALQPIAGTRIVKIDDPLAAGALVASGLVHEIDPPDQKDLKKQRAATQDARETAAEGGKED